MPFPVSIQSTPVVWDTLPVAKLIQYPFAKGSYRPFSQARICYVPSEGIYIRMWSFEVEYRCEELDPRGLLEDSCMTICLCAGENQDFLQVTVNAKATSIIRKLKKETIIKEYDATALDHLHAFQGEDLQGQYWGVEFLLTNEFLRTEFGFPDLGVGTSFQGNFYCTRLDGIKEHFGCLYPVHSVKPVFLPESFGEFQIVDY